MPRSRLRVLVVDPDPAGASPLGALLDGAAGHDFSTTWAATSEEAVTALARNDVEVCVVHHDGGFDFLRELSASAGEVPLILLTRGRSPEIDARALELGAADCLPRNELTTALLGRALRHAVERRGRRHAEAQLRAVLGSAGEPDTTALRSVEAALVERVKELRTLTLTGALLNRRDLRMRERLRRIVEIIPAGWQDPDVTEARLVLEGRTIATAGFRDSPWMISAEVPGQNPPGHLDVVLLPGPSHPDPPFLDEERDLLVNLARTIGDTVERERLTQLLSQTFRGLDDAVVVLDSVGHDRRVRDVNPAAERMFGFTRAELVGGTPEKVHPDRASFERLTAECRPVLERGGVFRGTLPLARKDGTIFQAEQTVSLLDAERGIEGGAVTIVRDVSERIALERQLRQGQKVEAIGRLAGGVAHDFNNILTVIRSQIELLLMDLAPGPTTDELLVIQSAAERATRLTSQLLAFSRDQILRPRKLSLSTAIRGLSEMMERVLGEDLSIEYRLDESMEPIEVDPDQLGQAVLNLAVNARDAMPEGGVLSIATYVEELAADDLVGLPGLVPDRYAVLRFADTGAGMPEEVRNKIFDPFFTTKPRDKGTGLGLAMIYGFVKQSGGGVHVESRPGEGATFYLRFPVVEGAVAVDEPEDAAPARGPGVDVATSYTVLVVEDDPNVRKVARKVLERSGYVVHALGDAEQALDLLRGPMPFDVLLTDLVLPGKSGRDLVNEVRDMRPALPMIVMSGYAEGSSGHRGDLPTDVGFLQKPFTRDSVLDAVRAAVAGT